MSSTDKSYVTRARLLKGKTLSVFKKSAPNYEFIGSGYSEDDRLTRSLGDKYSNCCCIAPGPVNVTLENISFEAEPGYSYTNDITWLPVENVTSYIINAVYNNNSITSSIKIDRTGPFSASISHNDNNNDGLTITVSAITSCGVSTGTITVTLCFLAGSLIQMADGLVKVIEDVKVGDLVLGAFGEVNPVLALNRPLLGNGMMCKINGEHSTTNHHPHISVDKKFYCNDLNTLKETTYGKYHKVLNEKGEEVEMFFHGLKKERLQQMTLGIELKTVDGSKKLETLEVYSMSPDTQLYNLVIGGSHTYHVDGYAVTGWPREDDFDYDSWTPRS